MRWGFHIQGGSSLQLNLSGHTLVDTLSCVSLTTLNVIKLTVKMGHLIAWAPLCSV